MSRTSSPRDVDQQGFTLVELVVAMAIFSGIIAMIFQTGFTVSAALRGESQSTSVVQTLRATTAAMASEIRQAGYFLPGGFRTAALGSPTELYPALEVFNDADGSGPDAFRVFYGDGARQTSVTGIDVADRDYIDVRNAAGFSVGDLVLFSNPTFSANGGLANANACVCKVTDIGAGLGAGGSDRIRIGIAGAPINSAQNLQCAPAFADTASETPNTDAVLLPLLARAYRIDPARKDLSVLQFSPSGGLIAGDVQDVAVGVTALQLATRFFEAGDTVDADGDGDPLRDWYSSEAQEDPDPTGNRPAGVPIAVSLSVETRTPQETSVVGSTSSAAFIADPADNNPIGDWPALDLTANPSSLPEAYRGNYAFRWATSQIDLRNLGVGK